MLDVPPKDSPFFNVLDLKGTGIREDVSILWWDETMWPKAALLPWNDEAITSRPAPQIEPERMSHAVERDYNPRHRHFDSKIPAGYTATGQSETFNEPPQSVATAPPPIKYNEPLGEKLDAKELAALEAHWLTIVPVDNPKPKDRTCVVCGDSLPGQVTNADHCWECGSRMFERFVKPAIDTKAYRKGLIVLAVLERKGVYGDRERMRLGLLAMFTVPEVAAIEGVTVEAVHMFRDDMLARFEKAWDRFTAAFANDRPSVMDRLERFVNDPASLCPSPLESAELPFLNTSPPSESNIAS